jgi:phosphatidate cytidylyltransferase
VVLLSVLKKRLLTVAIIVPPVIFLVWVNALTATLLAVIWGGLAAWEFYHNINRDHVTPLTVFGLLLTVLFIINPLIGLNYYLPLLLTASVVIPLTWLILQPNKENAFARWSWTVAGAIYIGWLLSYLMAIRSGHNLPTLGPDDARNWTFYSLVTNIFSDSMAYFVGRAFGKHHLAPRISPGKTWEGTFGGFLGAVLASLLFTLPTPLKLPVGMGEIALLGLVVSLAGQTGDLVKSLFKRNMGIKDSSNLLPGHGGFLDRLDSHLFAGVVVYYFIMFFIK